MGIRCLFGHDFGEPQTSREREERGDEVVETVKEYKECSRCGQRRLLGENTEVTSTSSASGETEDAGGGPTADASTVDDVGSVGTGEYEEMSAEEDDGVILENDTDESEATDARDARDPATSSAATGTQEAATPPESTDPDETEAAGGTDWPDTHGEDEGYSAEPGGSGPAEGVEFGGGLTPERTGGSETAAADRSGAGNADAEYVGQTREDTGSETPTEASGFEAAGPSPDPTEPATDTPGDLICARCGHLVADRAESFRPGDVCPECRSGYLAEQPTER